MAFLLGYDIGSSSIKASLLEAETAKVIASAVSPKTELEIEAKQNGWAEQHPDVWWEHVKAATRQIAAKVGKKIDSVKAIGISYQMHGLVIVDKHKNPLRSAIIWCDSRAVEIGRKAFEKIGKKTCLSRLLNSPGNFTASKLRWVKENEPQIYDKIYKVMLPGDYIAMRMTDAILTTISGLSEGILWDFKHKELASIVLNYYQIDPQIIPKAVAAFSMQGELTRAAATELGLKAGIPVTYRAGDQPNNAFSLKVLNPGEVAATAGTSGVVYGVSDKPNFDPQSRVNTFIHVNYSNRLQRYGTLLCINGTGILNRWIKNALSVSATAAINYEQMNQMAESIPVGSSGLVVLPYGNGAERTLANMDIGASIHFLNFNIHNQSHLIRAVQEGIVFAMMYGLEIMKVMGIETQTVRAGYANMFLSKVFCTTFATVSNAIVELYNTDGAQGAARGAGIGAKIYSNTQEAFAGLKAINTIEPDTVNSQACSEAYTIWKKTLQRQLQK